VHTTKQIVMCKRDATEHIAKYIAYEVLPMKSVTPLGSHTSA